MKQESEFRRIKDYIRGDVLEVGCGDGRLSRFLIKKASSFIGIDPEQKSVNEAKKLGGKFLIGSGESLDFEDSSFDAIVFSMSLHHMDPVKGLREAFRVLRNNGKIVVIEPVIGGAMQELFSLFEREDDKLEKARETISRYIKEKEEEFRIKWSFDDKEELYSYFSADYNIDRKEVMKSIDAHLKDRLRYHPIILDDLIRITVLRKE